MCDACKGIIPSDQKHSEDVCPIALAMTCSCCKVRGHSTLRCTKLQYWNTRIPEYVEQLIPSELRTHYQISPDQLTLIRNNTTSPLPCVVPVVKPGKDTIQLESIEYKPVIEIPEDKDTNDYKSGIRATLASNNLPTGSMKDNKKNLENFAKLTGKKVVYLKSQPNQNEAYAVAGEIKGAKKTSTAAIHIKAKAA